MLTLTGQITSGPSGQFILRCQARGEKPGRTVSEPLEPAPNVLGPYAHDPRGPRTHSGRDQPEKTRLKARMPWSEAGDSDRRTEVSRTASCALPATLALLPAPSPELALAAHWMADMRAARGRCI
jgi:hypothetical protein